MFFYWLALVVFTNLEEVKVTLHTYKSMVKNVVQIAFQKGNIMNIKTTLVAFVLFLVTATTVVAQSAAYQALNEKIESIMRSATAEIDDLVQAMEHDVACRLGQKSGDVCKASRMTCGRYVAYNKKVDESIAEVKRAIDASEGITNDERDSLIVAHSILSALTSLVMEYIISQECTKI